MMNTSAPRTLSAKRGRTSPLANSTMFGWPRSVPRWWATSAASCGWARPEYKANFLVVTFSVMDSLIALGNPSHSAAVGSVEGPRHFGLSDRGPRRQVRVGPDDGAGADLGLR